MSQIGMIEGFFGPTWSQEARLRLPHFLKQTDGDFYIYAPKRDARLRKVWREDFPQDHLSELLELKEAFQCEGIKFGLGFSPMGLGANPSLSDIDLLKNKFKIFRDLKIDMLGLFFDDMQVSPNLINVQKHVVEIALEFFPQGLIFCPSFYSFDPILDKVFGARPEGYMEGLKAIPLEVEICWTGPKVISPEISADHLREVTQLLGRKPFIWENLFANDGPKNCKFLKLKYFEGRDSEFLDQVSGIGFNLLNQPYLSQLVYLSSALKLKEGLSSEQAFERSCQTLMTPKMAEFIISHRLDFLERGLDSIEASERENLVAKLDHLYDGVAFEIKAWLRGEYVVGPECLTD